MKDYFPIELGFCITVEKAQVSFCHPCVLDLVFLWSIHLTTNSRTSQGRTIRKVVASLSEHPILILQFSWEQLYVVLSRIKIIITCDCCWRWTTKVLSAISRIWRRTNTQRIFSRGTPIHLATKSPTGMRSWRQSNSKQHTKKIISLSTTIRNITHQLLHLSLILSQTACFPISLTPPSKDSSIILIRPTLLRPSRAFHRPKILIFF